MRGLQNDRALDHGAGEPDKWQCTGCAAQRRAKTAATEAPAHAPAVPASAPPMIMPRTMRAAPRGFGGAHLVIACAEVTRDAATALAGELAARCSQFTVKMLPAGRAAAAVDAALASHALLLLSADCFKEPDAALLGVLDAWEGSGERAFPALHMLMDDVWHSGHVEGFAHYANGLNGLSKYKSKVVAGKALPGL